MNGRVSPAKHEEYTATVVDVADNITTVSASPAVLVSIFVNTVLSAHDLPIKDGGAGGTALITIPASTAAGTLLDFKGIAFATDLTVDPNDLATGNITVIWRNRLP